MWGKSKKKQANKQTKQNKKITNKQTEAKQTQKKTTKNKEQIPTSTGVIYKFPVRI